DIKWQALNGDRDSMLGQPDGEGKDVEVRSDEDQEDNAKWFHESRDVAKEHLDLLLKKGGDWDTSLFRRVYDPMVCTGRRQDIKNKGAHFLSFPRQCPCLQASRPICVITPLGGASSAS